MSLTPTAAYGKMRIGHAMAEGVLGWNEKALEIVYACTLCGACDAGCKRNLDLEVELTLEALRVKAVKDGVGPMPAHKKVADNIIKKHNCFGAPHKDRTEWLPKGISPSKKADVVYFAGCNASYVNKEIAQSTVRIFKAAGTDFMMLPDEHCCGNILFSVGMIDEAKAIAKRNVEEMRKSGAKTLITSCAEGYRMWKVDYPKLLNISTEQLGFKVLHLVEYADEMIRSGRLRMKRPFESRVTYHDACSLSRLERTMDTVERQTRLDGLCGTKAQETPGYQRRSILSPGTSLRQYPGCKPCGDEEDEGKRLLLRRRPRYKGGLPGIRRVLSQSQA